MKVHIFLIIIPKFQLQIHYTLEVTAEKYTYFRYTNFDFLMFFHNSLIPSVTYLFLPQERKLKVTLIKVENTHVQMGTTLFNIPQQISGNS